MSNSVFLIDTSEKEGHTFAIVGNIEPGKINYIPEKGYVRDDGNIYIFCKSRPDAYSLRYSNVARFWLDENGVPIYLEDRTPNHLYNVNSPAYHRCSVDEIDQNTPEGIQLYNESEIADMYASQSVYIPVIDERKDDPMKAMIKETILRKRVDINSYKSRVDKKYKITNLRSALVGETKMTITNWQVWADLMNFKFKIIIEDAMPNVPAPIGGKIIYDSATNTRTFVPESEYDDDDEEDYDNDL